MSTLASDVIRWESLILGLVTVPCVKAGLEWPPPERIYLDGKNGIRAALPGDDEEFVLVRTRISDLTDEQAAHPHLARGAEYRYATLGPA